MNEGVHETPVDKKAGNACMNREASKVAMQ
jgi:hypothetical protein